MMKNILFTTFIFATSISLSAQSFVQVSMGAGYAQQAYYRLSDDNVGQVANENWDLAFSMIGQNDVGV